MVSCSKFVNRIWCQPILPETNRKNAAENKAKIPKGNVHPLQSSMFKGESVSLGSVPPQISQLPMDMSSKFTIHLHQYEICQANVAGDLQRLGMKRSRLEFAPFANYLADRPKVVQGLHGMIVSTDTENIRGLCVLCKTSSKVMSYTFAYNFSQ